MYLRNFETIPGAGHGFKGADAERAEQRAFAFFDKHLKQTPPAATILISDHGPKGEIVAMEWPSGKELWTKPNERGHDVQSLPNGHVLFTIGAKKSVVELDARHRAGVDVQRRTGASARRAASAERQHADR